MSVARKLEAGRKGNSGPGLTRLDEGRRVSVDGHLLGGDVVQDVGVLLVRREHSESDRAGRVGGELERSSASESGETDRCQCTDTDIRLASIETHTT